MKIGHKNGSFLGIYYVALKIVTYVMSYAGYASLVKILFKSELIRAHLSSLRFFSLFSFTHLSSFRPILRFMQDHFEYIQGLLSSLELIQAHFGFRFMQAHLNWSDSFRLIRAHLDLFEFIQAHSGSFGLFKLI